MIPTTPIEGSEKVQAPIGFGFWVYGKRRNIRITNARSTKYAMNDLLPRSVFRALVGVQLPAIFDADEVNSQIMGDDPKDYLPPGGMAVYIADAAEALRGARKIEAAKELESNYFLQRNPYDVMFFLPGTYKFVD